MINHPLIASPLFLEVCSCQVGVLDPLDSHDTPTMIIEASEAENDVSNQHLVPKYKEGALPKTQHFHP